MRALLFFISCVFFSILLFQLSIVDSFEQSPEHSPVASVGSSPVNRVDHGSLVVSAVVPPVYLDPVLIPRTLAVPQTVSESQLIVR